jgi:hypothetical protein
MGLPLTTPNAATQAQVGATYGQVPLAFEPNVGQAQPQFDYVSHGAGYTVLLGPTGAVVHLQQTAPANPLDPTSLPSTSSTLVQMQFVGAATNTQPFALDKLPGISNYFIGNDPSQWHTGVANFGRVEYQNLYPGVTLDYYGNQQQLEYDLTVAPGTDPAVIRLAFQGVNSLSIDDPLP